MAEDQIDDEAPPVELCPSLQGLVTENGLNPNKLTVGIEANREGHIRVLDRHRVVVTDGDNWAPWQVASLRELFRGSQLPPADLDHYPPPYVLHFYFIERHLLTLSDILGDRTDQEMEEVYTALRRSPDGRSLSEVHDFFWQVAALLLGTRVLSGPEFEGLFRVLARSTGKWGLRPVSRNYLDYLRRTFDREE
jgi:hypothetical protein